MTADQNTDHIDEILSLRITLFRCIELNSLGHLEQKICKNEFQLFIHLFNILEYILMHIREEGNDAIMKRVYYWFIGNTSVFKN